jgi:hypothetical protein
MRNPHYFAAALSDFLDVVCNLLDIDPIDDYVILNLTIKHAVKKGPPDALTSDNL